MTKESSIKIMNSLLNYVGIGRREFSEKIGIKNPQWIADILNPKKNVGISKEKANLICSAYPEIRLSYLTAGEGNMLKSDPQNEVKELTADERAEFERAMGNGRATYIPLIHIDSVGGIHSHNQLTTSEQYVERLIPFPDARTNDVAILQSGDSMSPTIPPGAIMQIRRVEDWQEYFGYGNVYVLWLRDGRRITKLVKRYEPDSANFIMCCSYNPEADDEELPKSMILEVWKVVNVLINKGW